MCNFMHVGISLVFTIENSNKIFLCFGNFTNQNVTRYSTAYTWQQAKKIKEKK